MEAPAASGDPTIVLLVALITCVATILAPIIPAWLNRGGKAAHPDPPPIDLVAAQDEVNDHLVKELRQVRAERNKLLRRNAVLEAENDRLRQGHP